MSDREVATCRCSHCGCRFRVLADEEGTWPCPRCGYAPWNEDEEESEEEE